MDTQSFKFNFKLNIRSWNWKKFSTALLAAMSYLFVLVIVSMVVGRKNEFIAFHAKQGVALLVVWVVGMFSFYFSILPWIFALIILIYVIIGIVNVVLGREKLLPVIGRLITN